MRSATAHPPENPVRPHHAGGERSCYPLRIDPSVPPARHLAFGTTLPSEHYPLATETAPPLDAGGIWIGRPAKVWASHVSTIIRIQATDLRDAQRQTTQIRLAEERQGRDPAAAIVLLDVEAVIDHSNRSAFDTLGQLEHASAGRRVSGSVLYVGTASGLAGMITDIYAADVANGVTLMPLTIPGGFVRIVNATLLLLQAKGFDFDARYAHSSTDLVDPHDP